MRTIENILMTLAAGSQVSDRCPLGYLFVIGDDTLPNVLQSFKVPKKVFMVLSIAVISLPVVAISLVVTDAYNY